MDLPEHADGFFARIHLRAAAGVVGGIGLLGLEARLAERERGEDLLDPALEREEAQTRPEGAERQDLRLLGGAVRSLEVDLAELVEPGLLIADVHVLREDLEHRGQHGRAHDAGVLAEGVEDLQAVAARIVGRPADLVVVRGADEGVGDDLVEAEAAADLPQLALELLQRREAARGAEAAREADRDLVVAVEARAFRGNGACSPRRCRCRAGR